MPVRWFDENDLRSEFREEPPAERAASGVGRFDDRYIECHRIIRRSLAIPQLVVRNHDGVDVVCAIVDLTDLRIPVVAPH